MTGVVERPLTEVVLDREGCVLEATVIDGPGLPVVVTSGALGLRLVSRQLLARLVGRRKVVLAEVRGHGPTVCRHEEHYSWRSLTDDLVAWLDLIDVERCALVGTSLGSIVSLGVAVQQPERVESLTLLNAVSVGEDSPPDPEQQSALDALAGSFGVAGSPDRDALATALGRLVPGSEPLYRQLLPLHADLESVAAYFRLQHRGPLPYTSSQLQRLAVPALVVGGRDAIHPAHVSRELARLLPDGHLLDLGAAEAAESLHRTQEAIAEHVLRSAS